MTSYTNPWTGKLVDKISDLLPQPNGQTCDECGSPCIDNCLKCGAPQCCPTCCYDETPSARITGDKDRENPVEGAPRSDALQAQVAMYEALRRNCIGWENVIDLDLLPERHRPAAQALIDEAHAVLKKWREVSHG